MKVNIISPHASCYLGGMEIVTIKMSEYLAQKGIDVRLFTRKIEHPTDVYISLRKKAIKKLNIVEIDLGSESPLPDGTWPKFYHISCNFGVRASSYYSKYSDADLFVTHLSIDSIFIPPKNKIILHLHGNPERTDLLMDASINYVSSTIAHSNSIAQWWQNNYPSLKPSIFHNGIDTSSFTGNPNSYRPIDILYVGRFLGHKGITDIIEASDDKLNIVIAGDGPYLNEILKSVNGLQRKNINIIRRPSTSEIQKLYRESKIFACPSTSKEGLLTTLLEASASGCAIVTTSGSGMTDIVTTKNLGVVVSPHDVKALKEAFGNLLGNDNYRVTIAKNLQELIKQSWTWDIKTDELIDLYKDAI